jgi:hypothetical protein
MLLWCTMACTHTRHVPAKTGQGPPAQLSAVWRDMSAALSAWLAADQAPGSSGGYDRSTQQRALATARVLLAAAAAGGDSLEQVCVCVPVEGLLLVGGGRNSV